MEYRYVAYTKQFGLVKGQIEADSQAEASAEVARQGYKPLNVMPVRRPPGLEDLFPSLFQVSTGELVRFSRQLATIINSGGNLVRTLGMLHSESRNRVMRRTLQMIRKTLDEGGSLSSALAKNPKVFGPVFVSLIEVGEYTGRLGPALDQISDVIERDHEAKQKAMRTLMYPVAIMGLSLITLAVLVTVALPALLKVFQQMGAEIPLITRLAMMLVSQIKSNFREILLGLTGMAALIGLLQRLPRTKYWLDAAQTRVPIWGYFIVAGELSRFSRTIALLLEAGVPLDTALRLGTSGCKNLVLRRAFADAEESLVSGHSLAKVLMHHSAIPKMFVELVMIGEENNSLPWTMNEAARSYQKQLDERLNGLLGMLEPISTIVVGAIVGFIALSMVVPIYSGLGAIR